MYLAPGHAVIIPGEDHGGVRRRLGVCRPKEIRRLLQQSTRLRRFDVRVRGVPEQVRGCDQHGQSARRGFRAEQREGPDAIANEGSSRIIERLGIVRGFAGGGGVHGGGGGAADGSTERDVVELDVALGEELETVRLEEEAASVLLVCGELGAALPGPGVAARGEPGGPEIVVLVHLLHREDVRVERGELGEERLRAVLPPGRGRGGGLGFLAVGTRRG